MAQITVTNRSFVKCLEGVAVRSYKWGESVFYH